MNQRTEPKNLIIFLLINSLVHAVLLDYLNESGEEDRNEMIGTFLPHIAALASTKDGVHAAMLCFWHSIVKDRRVSILSFHLNLELGIIQIFQPISSIKSFINNFVTASLISRLF